MWRVLGAVVLAGCAHQSVIAEHPVASCDDGPLREVRRFSPLDGTMEPGIQKVFDAAGGRLQQCWESFRLPGATDAERRVMQLDVSREGRVSNACSVEGADDAFGRCVQQVAESLQFAPAAEERQITYPFLFLHMNYEQLPAVEDCPVSESTPTTVPDEEATKKRIKTGLQSLRVLANVCYRESVRRGLFGTSAVIDLAVKLELDRNGRVLKTCRVRGDGGWVERCVHETSLHISFPLYMETNMSVVQAFQFRTR